LRLRFVAARAGAAKLNRHAAEHGFEAERIAQPRLLRDFDGVLQLVREERDEPRVRALLPRFRSP